MRVARGFRGKYFSLAAIVATVSTINIQAQGLRVESKADELAQLKKQKEETKEEEELALIVNAPKRSEFGNESYTQKDISASKSKTLYDFLNRYTTIQSSINFGNKFAQKIDARGFGMDNGYQNIAVFIDGKKLNSIDMTPQMLSSIDVANIDKIEILKGFGAVSGGDGANSATIKITTSKKEGLFLDSSMSSNSTLSGSISGRVATESAAFSVALQKSRSGGDREIDMQGNKDGSSNANARLGVDFYALKSCILSASFGSNEYDAIFANAMNKSDFESNPKQKGVPDYFGNYYSSQRVGIKNGAFGALIPLNELLSLELKGIKEWKNSSYPLSGFEAKYDTDTVSAHLTSRSGSLHVKTGAELTKAKRTQSGIVTKKEFGALFTESTYSVGDYSFRGGIRGEGTAYTNEQESQKLENDIKNGAFELGARRDFGDGVSSFLGFQRSFLSPDVDRFFWYDFTKKSYIFNSFIKPQISNTYQMGSEWKKDKNIIKLTLFTIDTNDEIYYFQDNSNFVYKNTNLDATQKYGAEVEGRYDLEPFNLLGVYTYTNAKIKKEDEAFGLYEGKEMPMVPKHSIFLETRYRYTPVLDFSLSHRYRQSAYNSEDFLNIGSQKQKEYHRSDFRASYTYKNMEFYTDIENIFEYKNGYFVRDDSIFPQDFERLYRVGFKARF